MVTAETRLMELVLLFTGDDLSRGCPRVKLISAICCLTHPGSIEELVKVLYVNREPGDIDTELFQVIVWGYERYERQVKRERK